MQKFRKKLIITCLLSFILWQNFSPFQTFAVSSTNWDLSLMYDSEEAFNESLKYIGETAPKEMQSYKGQLSNETILLKALRTYEHASIESTKAFVYASMIQDTDSTNTTYNQYKSEATAASSNFESACAYMNEELLKMTDAQLVTLSKKPEFIPYSGFLLDVIESRNNALSEESQTIMANLTPIAQMPEEIYSQITLSDAHYDAFTNHLGTTGIFNPEIDTIYLAANDSAYREKAYEALYSPYSSMANSLAATYILEVQKNAFYAKSYGYSSSLEYAISGTIDPQDYKALIKASRDNVKVYQDYLKMKKEVLGFNTLKTSDLQIAYATEFNRTYPYEEAIDIVKDAVSPLGAQYKEKVNDYFTKGYIDVYPDTYKTSSQYSWGAYGSPTYILLNYSETLSDVSTLAHELGHAMNQEYTNQNQSFFNSFNTPFPAEVTSTFNELLLMDALNNKTKDLEEKLAYTQHELDFFIQTFFEQVMLADFEMQVYEQVDAGESLTLDSLNALFLETAAFYFGDAVEIEPFYAYYWMSIPHLYQNHYVYSYAMSVAVAQNIKETVDVNGESAVKKYEHFLSAGSSISTKDNLMTLGIKIDNPNIYNALFKRVSYLTQSIKTQLKNPQLKRTQMPTFLSLEQIEAYYQYLDEEMQTESANDTPTSLPSNLLFLIIVLIAIVIVLVISRRSYKKLNKTLKAQNRDLIYQSELLKVPVESNVFYEDSEE